MFSTIGIVQVRSGSQGSANEPARAAAGKLAPASKLGRRLGNQSLLEHVVRRVTESQLLDRVIAVCQSGAEADALRGLLPPDVPLYTGQGRDALARFVGACDHYEASAVVRVCADNPFVDPVLIDRLISTANEHSRCDYISYCSRDGRPVIQSALGVFAEWCRADALRVAHRAATSPTEREQVTRYLYSHPETFQLRFIPVPPELDRDDVRLTVHREEDWEHARTIYDTLGPDGLDWQRIAGLLGQQPALRERMALLNRDHNTN